MIFESLLAPFSKGVLGALGVVMVIGGSGYVLHRRYFTPSPLQEILEEKTGKKFSRQVLVSKEKEKEGVETFVYSIPAGLSVADILDVKSAIEDKLDCELDVWAEDKNFVFKISRNPIPKYVSFFDENIRQILAPYECGFYLGKSREGDVVIDFTENHTPHFLFGGSTGSGKSNLLNQGICGMVERYSDKEIALYLIDLKDGVELGIYQDLPHVKGFYETAEQVQVGLDNIIQEITRRNREFKKLGVKKLSEYNRVSSCPLPRIILIADEFAQFNNIGEKELKKAIYTKWETILQKGRSAGVHCIVGTQVADADVFPKQIKGNIDARFGFKFTDPQHSRMITGGSELCYLPNVSGRGIYKIGTKMIQVQTPFISLEEIQSIITKYRKEVDESEQISIDEVSMDTVPIQAGEEIVEENDTSSETLNIENLFMTEEDFNQKLSADS